MSTISLDLPDIDGGELSTLLGALPLALVAFGPDRCVVWANAAFAALVGGDRERLVGSTLADLPLGAAELTDSVRYRVAPPGGRRTEVQATVRELAGARPRLTVACLVPIGGARREVRGLGAANALGFSATGKLGARGIDPGTGLLDRVSINQVLQAEVSRSRRYENPLSIVFVRLARNAVFGAARILQEETRWADNLGRWDACELLLVLPETGVDAAGTLVAKLQSGADEALGRGAAAFAAAEWRRGDDATFLVRRARADLPRLAR